MKASDIIISVGIFVTCVAVVALAVMAVYAFAGWMAG